MLTGIVVTALTLLGTLPAQPAAERDARAFIQEMLVGIEAVPIECPLSVVRLSEEYEMGAACAIFDGTFDRFESRWHLHLLAEALRKSEGGIPSLPVVEPQTAWELSDGIHERIYTVGEAVVGVRFTGGDILIVYQ